MEGFSPCYFLEENFAQVWRSGNPDLPPAFVKWYATGYRLPTEAEWEYAAGGGHLVGGTGRRLSRFPGGEEADLIGWHRGNSGGGTRPVGSRRANNLGLFDMGGNVWEWCFDWAGGAYTGGTPRENPSGPEKGKQRVLRGGSWNDPAYLMRTANRNGSLPVYLAVVAGFRPVRTAR
jgi:formylglycine-generating enzyme required for sulfatase activity